MGHGSPVIAFGRLKCYAGIERVVSLECFVVLGCCFGLLL